MKNSDHHGHTAPALVSGWILDIIQNSIWTWLFGAKTNRKCKILNPTGRDLLYTLKWLWDPTSTWFLFLQNTTWINLGTHNAMIHPYGGIIPLCSVIVIVLWARVDSWQRKNNESVMSLAWAKRHDASSLCRLYKLHTLPIRKSSSETLHASHQLHIIFNAQHWRPIAFENGYFATHEVGRSRYCYHLFESFEYSTDCS